MEEKRTTALKHLLEVLETIVQAVSKDNDTSVPQF